jgi:hypothetical protein
VSHFHRLHPALQYHIVNSLGWRELRPFQEAVIPAILAEKHLIILAPTAGGKWENGSRVLPGALPDAVRRVDGPQCPLYLPDQGTAQQFRRSAAALLCLGGTKLGTLALFAGESCSSRPIAC